MSIWDRIFMDSYVRQYEPDGDSYLFRKYQREAPVRVTAAERDAFVTEFAQSMKYSFALMMVGFIALPIAIAVLSAIYLPDEAAIPLMLSGLLLVIFPYALFVQWSWNAATRHFAGRPVLGERRSSAEMRQVGLAALNYWMLGLLAVLGAYQLGGYFSGRGLFPGNWDLIRLVVGALLVSAAAVQSFRKWRMERVG